MSYNPLVDDYAGAPDPGPPPTDISGQVHSPMAPHIADLQGTPPLLGDHNIPLHVAALGIVALAIVIGLRLLGFRFSGVGKIGVGVGGR